MSPASTSRKFISLFSKYFIFILIFFVVVILGGGYYFFIAEKINEITQVDSIDLEGKFETKIAVEENLKKLEILNENYSKISEDEMTKLSKVLPTESEIPFLIIEVDNFIKENDLVLTSLDVGSLSGDLNEDLGSQSASVKELNISLGIDGIDSYYGLKNFLQVMSEQLPLFELSSINYNDNLTAFSLNLTTYYQ